MQSLATAPASVALGSTHVFAPALASPMLLEYNTPSASNQSYVATKIIKILDPD